MRKEEREDRVVSFFPGVGRWRKLSQVVVFGRDALWCYHLQNCMIPFTMV